MKKLLIQLNKPSTGNFWIQDLLVAMPRVIVGYLLTSSFGSDKFGMPWSPADRNLDLFKVVYWFPEDVAEYGGIFALFPVFFAWMGAFSEAVGGLSLALGLQTRVFGFLISCTMLVAIFLQKWGQGTWNLLSAMGMLWVGMYALSNGSGRFGLDYLISKKLQQ